MKLKVASDLHIEFRTQWEIPNLNEGDVLILAGDVISAKYLKKDGDNKKKAVDFFQRCSDNFKHIIYIEGNHSFYGCRYETTFDDVKEVLPSNFIHLENDKVKIGDYWFVGAVCWTNFNNEDPFALMDATRYMNDYRYIKYGPVYRKFFANDVLNIHKETMSYFEATLDELKDEKVIMVTHHTPTSKSTHPMYEGEPGNAYFNNHLDEWIMNRPQIKYWFCGHTHWAHNYKLGECEIICNPLGYPGENSGFDPNFTIELP
jgi:DNA repair exonuclease SbcCD nuclease subunit